MLRDKDGIDIPPVPRVIFHLDMDAFYASVEQRDDPSLRGRPVIVGAPPDRRGVVCAASYEARSFGVRSAMSSRTAHRLCPAGIFIRPRMDAYRSESREIMALLAQFGGSIEQMSVDEAYLDMSHRFESFEPAAVVKNPGASSEILEGPAPSGPLHIYGRHSVRPSSRISEASIGVSDPMGMSLGREMKDLIRRERGLTASIGIGGNKLLAKIASDHGKPDGLFCIGEAEKISFLRPLPASAIHGIGKVTADVLAQAGLRTIGDLQDNPGDLRALVGSYAAVLKRYVFGEDDRPLDYDGDVKSVSAEETFERDTDDRRILVPALREQSRELAGKLAKERLAARTVQVKVRYSDFKTLTRQTSVEDPIESAGDIYALACSILRRERLVNRPLRLLGLGVTGLVPPSSQLILPL